MPSSKPRQARPSPHSMWAGWLLTACFPAYVVLSFAGRFWAADFQALPMSMCGITAFVSCAGLAHLGGRSVIGLLCEALQTIKEWCRKR